MNKSVRRAVATALLTSVWAFAASGLIVNADAAQKGKQEQKKDAGPQARKEIGVPINDAGKLLDMKDFAGALAKVKQADMVAMKTPYEEYMVSKYLGFIAVNQPMPDYGAATAAYNRQIASGGAPDTEKAQMYNIAMRLNYQAMDFPKVIEAGKALAMMQPLDETSNIVMIQAYYNQNDFANAAQVAKTAVAADTAAGKKPNEDVLGLLLNSQVKTKDEAGYKQTLDQLASVSKKPEVWDQQMDFAIGNLGGKQGIDHQLLNLYRLALLVGTMKDADYPTMATIDLQNGLSAEAKAVLTKANKTGDLLNQANQLAPRDAATLPGLATEADKQTNGEVDIKLGESYMVNGQMDQAIASLQKGVMKGGLKDMADAQTTLGIALLTAGKKQEALDAFTKADMGNSPSAGVAHIWVLYVKREMAA